MLVRGRGVERERGGRGNMWRGRGNMWRGRGKEPGNKAKLTWSILQSQGPPRLG